MHFTYLIIMGIAMFLCVYEMTSADDGGDLKVFRVLLSMLVSAFMVVFSFAPCFTKSVQYLPAFSERVGNEIIVQAENTPTQIVDRIKFEEVPLQIKKITRVNSWGLMADYEYEVQIIDPNK